MVVEPSNYNINLCTNRRAYYHPILKNRTSEHLLGGHRTDLLVAIQLIYKHHRDQVAVKQYQC